MKLIPILFSTPMVKALLNGSKIKTRRVIKFNKKDSEWLEGKEIAIEPRLVPEKFQLFLNDPVIIDDEKIDHWLYQWNVKCKYGEEGDVLWVREKFRIVHHYGFSEPLIQYADGSTNAHCDIVDTDQFIPMSSWKPAIHMPFKYCRIFLSISKVHAEELNAISEEDAIAEGVISDDDFGYGCYHCENDGHVGAYHLCIDGFYRTAVESFQSLWTSINGVESWDKNPLVWVIEVERCSKPQ